MRVFVIRFSALGDCILLCPFLEHLKAHGASEVTVVTKRAYIELFAAARGVDRIVAIDEGAGLRGLRQVVSERRGEDAVVIDAHGSLRSRLLTGGLGSVDARITKHYWQRLALIVFKRYSEIPTVSQRYSGLGETLGYPPVASRVGGIDIPDSARGAVDAMLGDSPGGIVAIAPGSRWPMKRWGAEKYAELAGRITGPRGYRVVLLGDVSDVEDAAPIAETLPDHVTNLVGRTGILQTAAAIERASVFIGNDSGLMHLAEAVGVPVIALFGPTVQAFGYYPSLPMSKVIERELPCRPCSRNGRRSCPKGTQECLSRIPVEWVEEAFWDLQGNRGPARYVHG
jgi:heptosyltransferase-2